MKSKKLIKILAIITAFFIGIYTFTPTAVYADNNNKTTPAQTSNDGICNNENIVEEVKKAAGCPDYGNENALRPMIMSILNAIIAISGLIAVIYVIIGGINYMTSQGDAGKLQKAKNTILYALIGMTVAVLAFAIVNFVIVKIVDAGENSGSQETTCNEGQVWDEEEGVCKTIKKTNGSTR